MNHNTKLSENNSRFFRIIPQDMKGSQIKQFDFNRFESKIPGAYGAIGSIRWGKLTASVTQSELKGVILLLNGRSEFMEKYTISANRLTHLGYHIYSMDWRGQGLSLRELPNRHKGFVQDFAHYLSDFEAFFQTIIEPLQLPVTVMAHSMGGHITLRYLMEQANSSTASIPSLIEKVILLSPMLDIQTAPFPKKMAIKLADLVVNWGMGTGYAFGNKDYKRSSFRFKNNPLTHDLDNFYIEHQEIEKQSDLALGGVTWRWLKEAFDSIAIIQNEKQLSKINRPVWIASASEDKVVCNDAIRKTVKALPDGRLITVQGARHEILFETEVIQCPFWEQLSMILGRVSA